jgi:hypothetical protein
VAEEVVDLLEREGLGERERRRMTLFVSARVGEAARCCRQSVGERGER